MARKSIFRLFFIIKDEDGVELPPLETSDIIAVTNSNWKQVRIIWVLLRQVLQTRFPGLRRFYSEKKLLLVYRFVLTG